MEELILLTDGSVNTKSNIGYGAYLSVPSLTLSFDKLKTRVKVKRFENTTSTKLELQTLLWALGDIRSIKNKLIIYTDSQNITGLMKRRERLEKNEYRSRNNDLIANHELYREFYALTDRMNCRFIKVIGHQPSSQKDFIHLLFALVDRASREALRGNNR